MSAPSNILYAKEDYVASDPDSVLYRIYTTGIIYKHINESLSLVKRSFTDCTPFINKVVKSKIPRKIHNVSQYLNEILSFKEAGEVHQVDVTVLADAVRVISDVKFHHLTLWKQTLTAALNNIITTVIDEFSKLSIAMEDSYALLKRVHNHEVDVPITDPSVLRCHFTYNETVDTCIYVSCAVEIFAYLLEFLKPIIPEKELLPLKVFVQELKLYRKISGELVLYDIMAPNVKPEDFVLYYHKDFSSDERSKYDILVDMVENVPLYDPKQARILRNHVYNEYFNK